MLSQFLSKFHLQNRPVVCPLRSSPLLTFNPHPKCRPTEAFFHQREFSNNSRVNGLSVYCAGKENNSMQIQISESGL